jgi:hypothetical protein
MMMTMMMNLLDLSGSFAFLRFGSATEALWQQAAISKQNMQSDGGRHGKQQARQEGCRNYSKKQATSTHLINIT